MVKNLYKYEFLALFRWVLPIDAFCLIMSLLLRVAIEIAQAVPDSPAVIISAVLIGLTFFFSIIAMSVVAFWLVVVRFYKHLLSSEGYLTFTFPVSTTTHLVCKLVCGTVVSILSAVITLIGIIISFSGLLAEPLGEIAELMFQDGNPLLSAEVLPHLIVFIVVMLIMFLASAMFGLILPYTAMCIGQLSRKNKIAMSVVWYFVINTGISIISEIVNVLNTMVLSNFMTDTISFVSGTNEAIANMFVMYNSIFGFNALTFVIFIIAGFITCKYLLSNKLNLE